MLKLLVGLRNPGADYEHTRHNAGAWFLFHVLKHSTGDFKINRSCHSEVALFEFATGRCYASLPLTFMNQSGRPVRAISDYYKIKPEEILVIHDELDLPPGRVKLKFGGGHGGHNGLKDIMNYLNTDEFYRLRIGIGHPGHKDLVHDHVLSKPSRSDKASIMMGIESAFGVLPLVIAGDFEKAMNELHR